MKLEWFRIEGKQIDAIILNAFPSSWKKSSKSLCELSGEEKMKMCYGDESDCIPSGKFAND